MNSPSRPVTTLAKSDVLDGLFASWQNIDDLLQTLSAEEWTTPTSLPGWTVHDVVAHVTGTESMLQGVATPEADIDVSTLEHVRNDIGVMNEHWVRKLREVDPAELHQKFRSVTAERRKALSGMPDEQWNSVTATPAGPDTYGRFMRVRVFDCWMHELDIRDAVARPAGNEELVCPASAQAFDEMAASMGFVVGKRGGAPDGSRVSIELTGPLHRIINVSVEGRGRVVQDFGSQQPTSTITLDGVLFTRIAGGRTTPAAHEDAISYGGDEAVGRRIAEHLNYVI
ncbi:maleylpyruvate isomerase family mycothiol-dependent enzyme [Mycolicibacterium pyrenivorans]|uniref:maleylpyruvate isomerase family mycothiol-dependent enzyme n=1 Tax=Mycolicibacterium pyrenivorans TaxID=187102 RepID=UPI0021F3B2A4|nr:maleylpyruvate isomerase family mycothiol-dependent enzyme [Mycolicibacterium pyrenivorans]MCV7150303.1 maleylpyruvate isomerase family mycothiol-dependent enzyme [Mycolicibacterium pyrenivorans]